MSQNSGAITSAEGGCFCGKVRYRVEGKPIGTMVCHCQSCRRIAASPTVAWLTFPIECFKVTQGEPTEFQSSDAVRRSFCPSCGSPLTCLNLTYRDTIDITTCSLDDPNAFPPTHHSWLSHDLAWVHFGDGLPTFPESRTTE